jgi:hypothetical protein
VSAWFRGRRVRVATWYVGVVLRLDLENGRG